MSLKMISSLPLNNLWKTSYVQKNGKNSVVNTHILLSSSVHILLSLDGFLLIAALRQAVRLSTQKSHIQPQKIKPQLLLNKWMHRGPQPMTLPALAIMPGWCQPGASQDHLGHACSTFSCSSQVTPVWSTLEFILASILAPGVPSAWLREHHKSSRPMLTPTSRCPASWL